MNISKQARQTATAIRNQIDALRSAEKLSGISMKLARSSCQQIAVTLANSWYAATSPSSARQRDAFLDLALDRNGEAWRLEHHSED